MGHGYGQAGTLDMVLQNVKETFAQLVLLLIGEVLALSRLPNLGQIHDCDDQECTMRWDPSGKGQQNGER
jgi:hypothetical protein